MINTKGYVTLKAGAGRVRLEHIVIAERAIGRRLPAGAVVHHVDEDTARNIGANLCILQSDHEHKQLHARKRVFESGGDPHKDRWCSGCLKPRAMELFGNWRSRTGRCAGECRDCTNERRRMSR